MSDAAPAPGARIVRGTAAITAAGAVACGVCCVLPFALPPALLAASGGVIAWFGSLKPWVTAIAFVAVLGGWLWVAQQTERTRRRPARATLLTMSMSTFLMLAALAWPTLEKPLLHLIR
jgi:uncharacterized membrane protein YozB (DUF420 family)